MTVLPPLQSQIFTSIGTWKQVTQPKGHPPKSNPWTPVLLICQRSSLYMNLYMKTLPLFWFCEESWQLQLLYLSVLCYVGLPSITFPVDLLIKHCLKIFPAYIKVEDFKMFLKNECSRQNVWWLNFILVVMQTYIYTKVTPIKCNQPYLGEGIHQMALKLPFFTLLFWYGYTALVLPWIVECFY